MKEQILYIKNTKVSEVKAKIKTASLKIPQK